MAMKLRLTTEEDRALVLLASAWRCSKQEAAKRAIITSVTRLLDDAAIEQLAREVIAESHASAESLESRIRSTQRPRTSISFDTSEDEER
ncbi:CopG family transcriptional regulator [Corynebacterium cystitidis]|uniref:CopG family transcriptional regulator n=1 Tax=Corynebacterium cystitidis TaxID=35757 RepID=UPI00211E59E4|nr:CopG family transcriptional regulator [Corynebacterium cystitidis]